MGIDLRTSALNIIIIEDEKPSARRLERMLGSLNLQATALLHSVEESMQWFDKNPAPDLIFLDIQLSDGLSFEIFEALDIPSAVIFTTAYDEYALQAFKLNSIDYLLKPIDEDDLAQAVQKYKTRIPTQKSITLDFDDIKRMLIHPLDRHFKRRFSVKVGQRLKLIPVEDIECFFSENKGTYLYTSQGRSYLLDVSLEQLEADLDPNAFFRVNRKFYINIDAIKDMISYTNSRLQIKLNTFKEQEVIVARERVKDFKEWLN